MMKETTVREVSLEELESIVKQMSDVNYNKIPEKVMTYSESIISFVHDLFIHHSKVRAIKTSTTTVFVPMKDSFDSFFLEVEGNIVVLTKRIDDSMDRRDVLIAPTLEEVETVVNEYYPLLEERMDKYYMEYLSQKNR